MNIRQGTGSPRWRAAQVVLIYAVAGIVWISLSDTLLGIWLDDPRLLTLVQSLKGGAFIAVTAAILFVILYRQLRSDFSLLQRYHDQRVELRNLSQFRESVIDNASIWINVLDPMARVVLWNKAAEQISGYSRAEVLGSGAIWELLYPDADYRASVTQKAAEILEQGAEVEEFETCIRAKNGETKVIAWNSRRFFGDAGEVFGSIAIGRDVTARRQAEQALVARERQLAVLMANLPGMAYRCLHDSHWTMRFVSSGCLALTGYEPETLIDNRGLSYGDLVHPDDRARISEEVRLAVAEHRPFALEYRIRRQNGAEVWVWEQGRAVQDGDESLLEGIAIDITDRKRMEQELEQLARKDPLTGLYNRRELELQLTDELNRANRYGRPVALLWADVDNFKAINDRFGHLTGDEVLRRLSALLQRSIRNADYAARYGGEEMVVVMPEATIAEAMEMAERLRKLVESSRVLVGGSQVVSTTISVGVAAYPDHGETLEQLFEAADTAMYLAKQMGRNRVCLASKKLDEQRLLGH